MSLSYHKTCLLITGIILLFACEKDTIEPTYTDGVLKGRTFYSETDFPYGGPFPLENVTVKASGPYGSRTAITDAKGEYQIMNVGNGTYEIEFLKEGFGATKYYSVQIFGNEVLSYNMRMWKYPEFQVPALKTQTEEYNEGWITLRSDLPSNSAEIPKLRAFLSKTSDVSCFKYDYTYNVFDYATEDHHYYYFWLMPELWDEFVYIIFYLVDPGDNGEFDPYRDLTVFPSVNPKKRTEVIKYDIP